MNTYHYHVHPPDDGCEVSTEDDIMELKRPRTKDDLNEMDDGLSRETDSPSGYEYITTGITIVGFAMYWAAICSLLLSDAFSPVDDRPFEGFLLRMIMLFGFGFVQLLSHTKVPDIIDTQRRRLGLRVASCFTLYLLCIASLIVPYRGNAIFIIQAILWLALGMGSGILLAFWGVIWNGVDSERDKNSFCSIAIASSVVGSVLLCSVMLLAPRILCLIAAIVFYTISALLQQLCASRIAPVEKVSSAASRERLNLLGLSMMTPAALGFALGVVLALNGIRLGVSAAFPTSLAGIGFGALFVLVAISLLGATPAVSEIERIVFPVLCASMLLLPFLQSTELCQFVIALAIAALTAYLIIHWNVLVVLAYRRRLNPLYHFSQGLIATTISIAIGWAVITALLLILLGQPDAYSIIGWLNEGVPPIIWGDRVSITLVSCLLVVFVAVFSLSLAPYASNQLVEDLFSRSTNNADLPQQRNQWEEACESIYEEFRLTPREREVFSYLARGRNADHIASELIISIHTVKTHSARIYRKMGINSQQQLINAVEDRIDID